MVSDEIPHVKCANHNAMTQVCKLAKLKTKKTKLRDLSPRANYTDQATATCRRS
jgi:hypothetical protein